MKQLTDKEAAAHGISAVHHEMDNGELRFRLVSTGGSSYILTKSTGCNGWQNSHIHFQKQEFYVVEKGTALFALLQNGQVQFKKICENESLSIPLGVAHNVLLSENAVLHTVKYGTQDEDWNPAPELDEQLAHADTAPYMGCALVIEAEKHKTAIALFSDGEQQANRTTERRNTHG